MFDATKGPQPERDTNSLMSSGYQRCECVIWMSKTSWGYDFDDRFLQGKGLTTLLQHRRIDEIFCI